MSPMTSMPHARNSVLVRPWSQSMPFAWMMLSSAQRCSLKRFMLGGPCGVRVCASPSVAKAALAPAPAAMVLALRRN